MSPSSRLIAQWRCQKNARRSGNGLIARCMRSIHSSSISMSVTFGSIGSPSVYSGGGVRRRRARSACSRNQSTSSACFLPVQASRCACVGPKPARQKSRSTIAAVELGSGRRGPAWRGGRGGRRSAVAVAWRRGASASACVASGRRGRRVAGGVAASAAVGVAVVRIGVRAVAVGGVGARRVGRRRRRRVERVHRRVGAPSHRGGSAGSATELRARAVALVERPDRVAVRRPRLDLAVRVRVARGLAEALPSRRIR